MKKIYFWMGFLLWLAASAQAVVCGDVNGDNRANIVDALMVARYYTGQDLNLNTENADVNGDGVVNIVDALIIAQFSVGLIPALNCAGNPPPDIEGKWILDSHVNLSLVEDQLIYDHSVEDWTGYVTMTGFENKAVVTNASIIKSSFPMMTSYNISMSTEADVYPYYEFELSFGEHGSRFLMGVTAVISESPGESKRFSLRLQTNSFVWRTNSITTAVGGIPSDEGEDTLNLEFEILRDKTLLLRSGEVNKLPYEAYDEVPSVNITGNTFTIFFVYQTDIAIEIVGTVWINGSVVVLDNPTGSSMSGIIKMPIIFNIIYDQDDNMILHRQVTEPDEAVIYGYYGIDENNLQSCDYNQFFVK